MGGKKYGPQIPRQPQQMMIRFRQAPSSSSSSRQLGRTTVRGWLQNQARQRSTESLPRHATESTSASPILTAVWRERVVVVQLSGSMIPPQQGRLRKRRRQDTRDSISVSTDAIVPTHVEGTFHGDGHSPSRQSRPSPLAVDAPLVEEAFPHHMTSSRSQYTQQHPCVTNAEATRTIYHNSSDVQSNQSASSC